jgi:tetratricopeptide (TPR) repeat protein
VEGQIVCALLLAAIGLLNAQSAPTDTHEIVVELRSGDYSGARQLLDRALKQSPGNPALWTLNGFALTHLGDQREALESYNHALRLSPDYLPALEGAAQIEYQSSDQRAVPLLRRIVALRPSDQTSHAMLATLAFKRGDCAAAVKEFQASYSLISSQVASLEQYGSCLAKQERASEAIPVFQQLCNLRPGNNNARYNLAVIQVLAKRYADAVATLNTISSKDSDSLDLLAEAYEAMTDTPHAVAALRQAIIMNPGVPRYYVDFADICLAHAAYQIGIDMVNAGLKRLPASAELYMARGILYVQKGAYDEAGRDFETAERLNPSLAFGRSAEGLADLERNNLPQAERTIRAQLRQAPRDAYLYYLLGETLVREGASPGSPRFSEAIHSAKRAVQLQPRFPQACDLLGRLYLEEGNTQEAIRQSRLAFQQDPTDQTALYHLILALRKGGHEAEIEPLAKKLAELREQARAQEAAEHRYALIEGVR